MQQEQTYEEPQAQVNRPHPKNSYTSSCKIGRAQRIAGKCPWHCCLAHDNTVSSAHQRSAEAESANLEQGRIFSTLHHFMLSKVQTISACIASTVQLRVSITQYTYDGTRWMLASTLLEAEWCDGNINMFLLFFIFTRRLTFLLQLSLQRGDDN